MQWKCNVRKRAAKDKTTLDFAKEIERKSRLFTLINKRGTQEVK